MPIRPRLISLWRNLFENDRVEQELTEEIHAYVEMLVETKIRQGLRPTEARHAGPDHQPRVLATRVRRRPSGHRAQAHAGVAGQFEILSQYLCGSHFQTDPLLKDQSAGRFRISAKARKRAESVALFVRPALFSNDGARLLSFPISLRFRRALSAL
jgi:hypothetical protein